MFPRLRQYGEELGNLGLADAEDDSLRIKLQVVAGVLH
jgi:hypothetical protein